VFPVFFKQFMLQPYRIFYLKKQLFTTFLEDLSLCWEDPSKVIYISACMEGSGKPCQKMSGACQQFFWFVISLIRFSSASPSWVWMEKWNSFIQHWKVYGRFASVCLWLWINKNGFWKMPDLFQMVSHNTSPCRFSPASKIATQCGTVCVVSLETCTITNHFSQRSFVYLLLRYMRTTTNNYKPSEH